MTDTQSGRVIAVNRSGKHSFSKPNQLAIRLVAGLGVEGDAHAGTTIQHMYPGVDPTKPNLRQVHLMHDELFDELRGQGFTVSSGDIGENITTHGLDLLNLPTGARLRLGDEAVIEITGLRTPCFQIDRFQKGLLKAVLDKDADGRPVRKSGIMSIVVTSGEVRPGDPIFIELPPPPHRRLEPV